MNEEQTLIIFARNPCYGKVKTRLAASIGHEKALAIYRLLLQHTASVSHLPGLRRVVCFSESVEAGPPWEDSDERSLQQGKDLGERMSDAFEKVMRKYPGRVAIIGTDCYALKEEHLTAAFSKLNFYDVVIGPAEDGGYYLLGMNAAHAALFEQISWSSDQVLAETKARCRALGLSYYLLPVLNDIDDEDDLKGTNLQNI